ncbi:MAG: dTMP kinase [Elainellaceae cyanobacterium]
MQGKLIVFEGVEGCGKTTQLQLLQQYLKERLCRPASFAAADCPIFVTREPGGTALGKALRQLLLAPEDSSTISADANVTIQPVTELLLYAADRAQHVMAQLQPELSKGSIILCDRYTDSTVAYQGFGRGLDRTLIDSLNQIATAGLQSDLTLWLDLDVEQSLSRARQRGKSDRMEQSGIDFHRRVRDGFAALASAYPGRIVRVDASGSIDEVADAIQQIVQQRLERWQRL